MYLLDIEALDLGPDVRAVGLDLAEADENREPVRGEEAARIWSRVIRATAGNEPWALDFFSHVERVRDFCEGRGIEYREANKRSIVIPAPEPTTLDGLIGRFEGETFGVRAGGALASGEGSDPALEGELARRGADAYRHAFPNYYFCAICGFEDGSLVVLSEKLWGQRGDPPSEAGAERSESGSPPTGVRLKTVVSWEIGTSVPFYEQEVLVQLYRE